MNSLEVALLNEALPSFSPYYRFKILTVLEKVADRKAIPRNQVNVNNIRTFLVHHGFIVPEHDRSEESTLTDKGRILRAKGSVEAYKEYVEIQRKEQVERKRLEMIKLKREVIFWRDPRYWLGVISGAITTGLSIVGVYLAWKHK